MKSSARLQFQVHQHLLLTYSHQTSIVVSTVKRYIWQYIDLPFARDFEQQCRYASRNHRLPGHVHSKEKKLGRQNIQSDRMVEWATKVSWQESEAGQETLA